MGKIASHFFNNCLLSNTQKNPNSKIGILYYLRQSLRSYRTHTLKFLACPARFERASLALEEFVVVQKG
jgi:hypothetical protein